MAPGGTLGTLARGDSTSGSEGGGPGGRCGCVPAGMRAPL
jgi:hypothetical protein